MGHFDLESHEDMWNFRNNYHLNAYYVSFNAQNRLLRSIIRQNNEIQRFVTRTEINSSLKTKSHVLCKVFSILLVLNGAMTMPKKYVPMYTKIKMA